MTGARKYSNNQSEDLQRDLYFYLQKIAIDLKIDSIAIVIDENSAVYFYSKLENKKLSLMELAEELEIPKTEDLLLFLQEENGNKSLLAYDQPANLVAFPIEANHNQLGTLLIRSDLKIKSKIKNYLKSSNDFTLPFYNQLLEVKLSSEVVKRESAESVLKEIADGTTAKMGEDYLQALVKRLSFILNVKYVFITRCLGKESTKLKTVAYAADSVLQEDFEYDIEGGPCEEVIAGNEFYIRDQANKLFPKAENLISYLGVPVKGIDGNIAGHLCIEDDKPMNFSNQILEVLRIFASRIGSEFAHQNLEKEIEKNLGTQKVLNELLRISLEDYSLKEQLQNSLAVILSIHWLPTLPKGAIFLIDPRTENLHMEAQQELDAPLLLKCNIVKKGECLCGKAAETGELVYADCINADHTTNYPGMPKHGHYILPIKSEEKLLGVMALYLEHGHKRDENEIMFLDSVASSLASMIKRKTAEQNLHIRSSALGAAANGITIFDANGNFEWVNPAFTQLTGYTLEEVKGTNPRILRSGQQDRAFYKDMWNTIIAGNIWQGEVVNRRKDGSLYYEEQTITPVRDAAGNIAHYIAIRSDISLRKQREKELLEAKQEAEKSEQMKSHFLAQMSHEIRTPINTILNYSSLLHAELQGKSNGELKPYFEPILNAGSRITRTIDLILNMSEIQTVGYKVKLQEIEIVSQVLDNIYRELRGKVNSENVNLDLEVKTDDTRIFADDYAINQIIINLLDNAIKYTESGSIVTSIDRNDNNNLMVTIRDSGIGISNEYLPNLFKPFSQEETGYTRKFDGNGLGLALVKEYCDLNNIEIEVQSKKGKGTEFRLIFGAA